MILNFQDCSVKNIKLVCFKCTMTTVREVLLIVSNIECLSDMTKQIEIGLFCLIEWCYIKIFETFFRWKRQTLLFCYLLTYQVDT